MGDNKDTQSSAESAIAALAKRFWSIHPKEIQDLGITREQFYEQEMRALFAALVPNEPQTIPTRDQIAQIIAPEWFLHGEGLSNYQGQHIQFQNRALEKADAILALSRPEGK